MAFMAASSCTSSRIAELGSAVPCTALASGRSAKLGSQKPAQQGLMALPKPNSEVQLGKYKGRNPSPGGTRILQQPHALPKMVVQGSLSETNVRELSLHFEPPRQFKGFDECYLVKKSGGALTWQIGSWKLTSDGKAQPTELHGRYVPWTSCPIPRLERDYLTSEILNQVSEGVVYGVTKRVHNFHAMVLFGAGKEKGYDVIAIL